MNKHSKTTGINQNNGNFSWQAFRDFCVASTRQYNEELKNLKYTKVTSTIL